MMSTFQMGSTTCEARARDLAGNERSTDRPHGRQESCACVAAPHQNPVFAVGKRTRVRARGANGKRRYRIVLIEKPRSR